MVLIIVIVVIIAVGGYFVFVKKSEPIVQQPTPSAPTLTFTQGAKPFVQINFDYSIAKLFNIYRSTSAIGGWQKIISNFPSNAHTAIDYDYPKNITVLYYQITSIDEQGKESTPSVASSVLLSFELAKETALQLLKDILFSDDCRSERVVGKYASCTLNISKIDNNNWTVTVTYDGLYDDSAKATRTQATVMYQDGQWLKQNISKTHQCWPNRGHQDFSTATCS